MAIRTTFELEYSPPLDWAFFLRYLGVRATPGVETAENGRYIRTFATGRSAGTLCVSHHPTAARLVVATDGDATAEAGPIARRIRRMFDLDADLPSIHRRLGADPRLKSLLDDFPGIRIPGAWSAFELLVRTIVGQQVTVKAATTIIGRIAGRLGTPSNSPDGDGPFLLFPPPEDVARGRLDTIGMPARRVAALRNVARVIAEMAIPFSGTGEGVAGVRKALLGQPGIGPWTVEYFALRALREPDAWPETDLILRRSIERQASSPSQWRPYRGYAAMHLWNEASRK
jgi:DNA-3-methyladenine glycosylase II